MSDEVSSGHFCEGLLLLFSFIGTPQTGVRKEPPYVMGRFGGVVYTIVPVSSHLIPEVVSGADAWHKLVNNKSVVCFFRCLSASPSERGSLR